MDMEDTDITDYGSQTTGPESSEEISLIQDLERELGAVVQRHRVPPDELQQLFEVVQRMFDLMDNHREALNRIEAERNELDERWKREKENLRKTQKHKLELENQLEEEKTRIELEKIDLEKKNVVLETKVKQLGEQRQYIEQELHQLKQKAVRDEQTRQELIEQYKRQIESAPPQQRIVIYRMQSPMLHRQPIDLIKRRQFSASLGAAVSNVQPLEESVESDVLMIGSMEVPREEPSRETEDELEIKEAEKQQQQQSQQQKEPPPSNISLDDEFRQLEQQKEKEEEEHRQREEELHLQEEMMAEVEMMQKEKEGWEEERKSLEQGKAEARAQMEALEQQNAELQVEVKGLKETHESLKERFTKVVKERNEVYDNYLKQPLSAYNISRKELHNLLMKQQATASELDNQRDQTLKYKHLYAESTRSYYDKFKEKMWKLFSKQTASSTEAVRYSTTEASLSTSSVTTPITPLRQSIAMLVEQGSIAVERGWLLSSNTSVSVDYLPLWMGQVPLKSVVIERIESVELGRIYYTPPDKQQEEVQLQAGLHAEVWVTMKEKSMSVACVNIEVIDILAMPPKVCQRFILKPETPHIVCMRSIPGVIEETKVDWVSSGLLTYSSSGSQHKLSSEGVPLKSGSLEHGKTSADIGPLDLESIRPTSSGNGSDSINVHATDEELDSITEVEGHKSIIQQQFLSEGDDEVAHDQQLEDITIPADKHSDNDGKSTEPHASDRKFTDGKTPLMWIITENNMLCFYPTVDPRHRPLNIVKLESRATCMEYLHGSVFIGHEASTISVYSQDEFSFSWDLKNPQIMTLPSHNPEIQNDVRCIAAVKNRVWVGAGPSIFFLSAESLECEGSRFLNVEHFPPDQILPLGDIVAVAARGSSVFLFEAESTNFLKKFDVYPMTKHLVTVERNSKWKDMRSPLLEKIPTIIKTMVADENMLYVGTSQGMVVAIPIDSLNKESKDSAIHIATEPEDIEEGATGVANTVNTISEGHLDNCALALHVQKDSRVKSLLHLQLPIQYQPEANDLSSSSEGQLQYSLPNIPPQSSTSFSQENDSAALPSLSGYRSLIISAGKGHMEYSAEKEAEDTLTLPPNYNSLREKNEEHQLLVWGHKL